MALIYITPDAGGYCTEHPQRARLTVHLPPVPVASQECAPCALVLVIDRSASAAELSSEALRAGLVECLTVLMPGDRLALITYSNCVQVLLPLGEPGRDSLLEAIDGLPPCSGVADPHFGWLAAINELKRCPDLDKRTVLILSPGGATVDSYRLAQLGLEYASAAEEGCCTRILQPILKSSIESTSYAFEVISMYGRGMTRRFEPAVETLSDAIVAEVRTITSLNLQDVRVEIEPRDGVTVQLHGMLPAWPGWRLRNLGPGDKLEGLDLTFSVVSVPSSFPPGELARDERLISGVYFLAPADCAASTGPVLKTLFKVTIRGKRVDGRECDVGSSILELPLINHERFVAQAIKAHCLSVERESRLAGAGLVRFPGRKGLRDLTNRECVLKGKAGVLELAMIRFVIWHGDLLYVLCRLSPESELARENGSHDMALVADEDGSHIHECGSIHISLLGWEVLVEDEWVKRVRMALQQGTPKSVLMRELIRWRLDAM